MKYLLLAGILLLICFLIYRRLRPYIILARRILNSAQAMRSMHAESAQARVPVEKRATGESLVRCAGCGTWFPATRALHPGRSSTQSFCSTACIESRATNDTSRQRKTAT